MLAGVAVIGIALSHAAAADVIRLKNGSVIEVDGWRDAGDAVEFSAGGGIIRISKSDVDRIEGQPTRGDLPMYSAPAPPPALDRAEALRQMADLLRQGAGLGAQTALTAAEKAGAARRLAEAWQALGVPEALKALHGKGGQALQAAAEAYASEGSAAGENAERARAELQAAQDELKKAGEQG
jgi:hypothetical protein